MEKDHVRVFFFEANHDIVPILSLKNKIMTQNVWVFAQEGHGLLG
jgi:hypothetical protein